MWILNITEYSHMPLGKMKNVNLSLPLLVAGLSLLAVHPILGCLFTRESRAARRCWVGAKVTFNKTLGFPYFMGSFHLIPCTGGATYCRKWNIMLGKCDKGSCISIVWPVYCRSIIIILFHIYIIPYGFHVAFSCHIVTFPFR